MASNNLMVGLEIGTSKICVVVGESRTDGTLKILGVGQAPSRGVRKGEIVDFETAMKCVHEAVVDAEQKSDVMIRSVYVAVAGSHLQSFNNRGCVMLPEDRDEIDEQDAEDVKINAREVSIPAQNAFLHSLIQHYHVDGQDGVLNPIGMLGQKLEADFHIIYGVRTRIQNTIRCVKELPLDVEDVVFGGLASAQFVLTQHQKDLVALVIDMGGGTTYYERAKIFLMLREHNLGRSKPAKNNILHVQRQFFDTADGILNPGTHAIDDVKIGLQFLTEHPDWI